MSISMIHRRVLVVLAASSVWLAACRKPTVESYRVPKDPEPPAAKSASATPAPGGAPAAPAAGSPAPAAAQGAMASTAVPTAGGPGLVWTAPANWGTKSGSAMRKATYVLKSEGVQGEGELAITAFPGDVGGELANVNRWRGQISLPPLSQADLGGAVTRLDRNGLKLAVVDLTSPDNTQRMLGAMVPNAGSTWFFKLTGPSALVEKVKPEFMAFLDTIKAAP
jgi:hypothetical protein